MRYNSYPVFPDFLYVDPSLPGDTGSWEKSNKLFITIRLRWRPARRRGLERATSSVSSKLLDPVEDVVDGRTPYGD